MSGDANASAPVLRYRLHLNLQYSQAQGSTGLADRHDPVAPKVNGKQILASCGTNVTKIGRAVHSFALTLGPDQARGDEENSARLGAANAEVEAGVLDGLGKQVVVDVDTEPGPVGKP